MDYSDALTARNAYALAGAAVAARKLGHQVRGMQLMTDNCGSGRLSLGKPIDGQAFAMLASAANTAPRMFCASLASLVDQMDEGDMSASLSTLPDAQANDDPAAFLTSTRTIGGTLPDTHEMLEPHGPVIHSLARLLIGERVANGPGHQTSTPIDLIDDDAADLAAAYADDDEEQEDEDEKPITLSAADAEKAIDAADDATLARMAASINPKLARLARLEIEFRSYRPGDNGGAGVLVSA